MKKKIIIISSSAIVVVLAICAGVYFKSTSSVKTTVDTESKASSTAVSKAPTSPLDIIDPKVDENGDTYGKTATGEVAVIAGQKDTSSKLTTTKEQEDTIRAELKKGGLSDKEIDEAIKGLKDNQAAANSVANKSNTTSKPSASNSKPASSKPSTSKPSHNSNDGGKDYYNPNVSVGPSVDLDKGAHGVGGGGGVEGDGSINFN